MNPKELLKQIPKEYIEKFGILVYPRENVLLINKPAFINMGSNVHYVKAEKFISIANAVACVTISTHEDANPAMSIELKNEAKSEVRVNKGVVAA